eukprot:380453-Prorocentrum_minimum.AAC.1
MQRLESEQKEVACLRLKNKDLRTHIGRMQHDIELVVGKIQQPAELRRAVTKFYHNYNTEEVRSLLRPIGPL